jgi:NitT/TauT family transport system permease protein
MNEDVNASAGASGSAAASDAAPLAALARARARRRRAQVRAAQAATVVIILGAWEILSRVGVIDPFFFGSPLGIISRLADWAVHGTAYGSLWLQIWVTIEESVLGFMVGVLLGVACGVTLGEVAFLADVFAPFIKAVNALPRIVLGSIFIMWLGLGLASKVMLAAVLVFFVVFFNAFQGVRSVDRNFVANARILGATRLQVVRHVVIPSAMTWIIASLHVALGLAIIGAIVGEFLGSQYGLGLVIATAQNTFDANGVFAAMLIIGVLAVSAEAAMEVLERRLLAWRPPAAGDTNVKGV